MAFAVRQWPDAPDPRSSHFSFAGWDWGKVPPFQFVLTSTNATGIYAWLNDGLVLANTFDDGLSTQWSAIVPGFDFTLAVLSKVGTESPAGAPTRTITFTLIIIGQAPVLDATAGENLTFPDAIRVFGPWVLSNTGGPIAEVPDGITLTPAKWDFVLP